MKRVRPCGVYTNHLSRSIALMKGFSNRKGGLIIGTLNIVDVNHPNRMIFDISDLSVLSIFQKMISFLVPRLTLLSKRPVSFSYVYYIWNRVDQSRIKEVGPDIACAEWLLRNSAYCRFNSRSSLLTSYSAIPQGRLHKLTEMHAVNCGVTYHGFAHLKGLKHLSKVILVNSEMVNSTCLLELKVIENSLTHLEVERCHDISLTGIESLSLLSGLKYLRIHDIENVTSSDTDILLELFKRKLPDCNVVFGPSAFVEAEHVAPPGA